jgi:glutathione S-transferase
MSTLKIYGAGASRAARAIWMAKELGLDYEHIPIGTKEAKEPDYLKINPNGRIPAIQDGDLCLWESMAINLYLARKHGGELAPKDLAEEGLTYQWSFWVMTEVEGAVLTALMHTMLLPEEQRDSGKFDRAVASLKPPFDVLEKAMVGREYLVADRFTVADLNVAAVLGWTKIYRMDLSPWPNIDAWLSRCLGRPAYKAARGG